MTTIATQTDACLCAVTYTDGGHYRIEAPNGKACEFTLPQNTGGVLTTDQLRLLTSIRRCGDPGVEFVTTISYDEMHVLVAIRSVCAKYAPKYAPVVVDNPVQPKPPVTETKPCGCCVPVSPTQAQVDNLEAKLAEVAKAITQKPNTPTTYTRNGESVTTTYSKDELLTIFKDNAGNDNWVWYWLAKWAENARTAPAVKDMRAFLADLFTFAIGMGLKRPMVRVYYKNRRYKIYLSDKGNICFKGGNVHPDTKKPVGNESYVGCIVNGSFLTGTIAGTSRRRTLTPDEAEFIHQLSQNPVGFMAKCSRDMDRCCYCNKPLTDSRSKEKGYGPDCAEHWGLPWGKKNGEQHVPSFAELWGRSGTTNQKDIRGMCQAIRKSPRDAMAWAALSDALEEAGYTKRLEMPEAGVRVPAA